MTSICSAAEVLDTNRWKPLTKDNSIYIDLQTIRFSNTEIEYGKYGHNLALYWACYINPEQVGNEYSFIREAIDFDDMESASLYLMMKNKNGKLTYSDKVVPVEFIPILPGSFGEHLSELLLRIKASRQN